MCGIANFLRSCCTSDTIFECALLVGHITLEILNPADRRIDAVKVRPQRVESGVRLLLVVFEFAS